MGFFERLRNGLLKTKHALFGGLKNLFRSGIDEDTLEELEELLICADVGFNATEAIIDQLRERTEDERAKDPEAAIRILKEILVDMIGEKQPLTLEPSPAVILVIGVNGVGKTTSIAKIAHLLKSEGKEVLLAAADTFRAGAIDQLQVWADRAKVELIKQK